MATSLKTAGVQYSLHAEFIIPIITDSMVNTSSVLTAFKASSGTVYDIFTLPPGAQVIGGDVTVQTISDESGTATIIVGDSGSTNRYLTSTTIKTAARTALVPTGRVSTGEAIRITLANQNGDATVGKVKVVVAFIIEGRVSENAKTT